ncbi:hypothetical protein HDU84_002690 [Entophlyctis sp. JEL0112]|nr:hypothetical protein HDU84_002690 [Entophlyctis sp. JEL0112]
MLARRLAGAAGRSRSTLAGTFAKCGCGGCAFRGIDANSGIATSQVIVGDSQDRNSFNTLCGHAHGTYSGTISNNGEVVLDQDFTPTDANVCVVTRNNHAKANAASDANIGKRADGAGDAETLVLINMFHFGISRTEAARVEKHSSYFRAASESHVTHVRVANLKRILATAAAAYFPHFCASFGCPAFSTYSPDVDPVRNHSTATPDWYPVPDAIVFQSSLWDLKLWLEELALTPEHVLDNGPMEEYMGLLKDVLVGPARDILRGNRHQHQKIPKSFVATRTTPRADNHVNLPVLSSLNNAVRRVAEENNVPVVDWARLVEGQNCLKDDGYHQNDDSQKAMLEWLFHLMYLRKTQSDI